MLSIGQAVRLNPGSAWDRIVSSIAIGVIIGFCSDGGYQLAFPTGDGRSPLVGQFAASELIAVGRG